MKNSKHVKPIVICSLSALCIAILIGAFFLTREPESEFEPIIPLAESTSDNWSERADTIPEGAFDNDEESNQIIGAVTDKTQEIIAEDETETIIDLSGSTTGTQTEAPEAPPETAADLTDPESPPSYDSSVPQTTESTPPPASTSQPGRVYDPVFGWIETGPTQVDVIDSAGDINNQVGSMGN